MDHGGGCGEPRVVTIAREVWAGLRPPDDFHVAFNEATLFAQRPETPGLFVTDLGQRGRWTLVFSRPDRLGTHCGDCDYLTTTGADLLHLVPAGVGVLFDPGDEHRFPVLTRVAGTDVIAEAWNQQAGARGRMPAAKAGSAGRTR